MSTYEIAKEVLAVSLHIAESHNFDLQETKKRMQQLTESVLKTNLLKRQGKNANQTVDLEFQQIDNLKDLLPHLANCSNLRELILHGNRLHTLPDDLSILTTVETLDISNNLFDDIVPIVRALKTMPKLIHLHIGFNDRGEEQYIIQQLTNLITLNNKRIRFFDQLDSERQSGRQSARSEKQQEVQFNQEDVQNMESLYEQICNLTDKESSNQLQEHVRLVMTEFSDKVSQTHSKHFLDTHILKVCGIQFQAKFDLYEICFRELIDYFRANNNRLEKVLQSLQEENQAIFNDLTNIIYNLKDYKKIQSDNQHIEQAQFNSELVARLNQEIQTQKSTNFELKQELLLQTQQKNQFISRINDLENQIQIQNKEKENIFNQCSQLEFQLAQVRSASHQNSQKQLSQNQSFQDLQSFSYMQTQQVVLLVKGTQTLPSSQEEKQCQTVDFEETKTQSIAYQSMQQELEDLQCQNEQLQVENKKYLEMIIKKTKGEILPLKSESFIEKKRVKSINESRLLVSPQSFRPLSLKQLKECIDDIFESKYKHDLKQYENKMPLETIEQHMYTFLNCKYGLKNLALEWAACIINAVYKYLSEDNDVAVFALMLKNEIDEDFRKTQNESKRVVEQLIKLNLQGKYKNKHISEIKELVKQKINGYLTHQEVLEILSQIYKKEEIDLLIAQLKQHTPNVSPLKNNGAKQMRRPSAQKTSIQYEYADFIKVALDYQMKQHQLYISCIVHGFQQVDQDSNGIINEVQFRKLIEILNIQLTQEEYVELYNNLDPFMNNQLTFSQLVRVFSNSALFDHNKNLMQKIQLI